MKQAIARRKKSQKAWRDANKEYLQKKKKEYREANREWIIADQRERYLKDRAARLAKVSAYYYANKARISKASQEAHQKDPRRVMLSAAKARAKKKGVTFCLVAADIAIPLRCPVLDIPLVVGKGGRQPNSPSLDRVNPKGPYAPFNCRVISFKANTLKNDGTIEDHERVIAYMKGLL